MFGKVIKKEINKMGLPYAIIKGTNGITYYCDNRGMEEGKIEEIVVGANVEYVSYKDKKGKLIATHLKCIKELPVKESVMKADMQFLFGKDEKERVKKIIIDHITNTGPIFLTSLNVFLLSKEIDYHTYGYKKPKNFFRENFSDVLDFEEVDVNGCPQIKIQLKNIDDLSVNIERTTLISETENITNLPKELSIYEEFERLIENEDYEGALRSSLMNTVSPDKLSLVYMEKAIFAARKLLGIDDELILSEFDKKIITMPMSSGLFIIKKDTDLMKEGQEECFESCNAKQFQKFFNALSETNTHNTTYLAIAIRFQTVYNKLYLPFYVLAAYTSKKIAVADEFIKFTQKKSVFDYFIVFNKIIKETIFSGQEVTQNYITKVLSIALDYDRFDLFVDFCSQILGGMPAFVRWIDEEELQYEKIVDMLSPNSFLKEKVVEKYINFYIYKKLNDGKRNKELIRLLSEIAYAHPISYLEEILANNSYVGFSKVYKSTLLLDNFMNIVEYIKVDPKAYLLACFVIEHFMGDDTTLPEEYVATARMITSELSNKVKNDSKSLYEIYPLFKLDASGRNVIEEAYCDYMDATYSQYVTVEESKAIVHEFNSNNCSFATVYFIENRENSEDLLKDGDISVAYLSALKSSTNYAKAIRYVKNCKGSTEFKAREIIKILYMNFKEFGVSSKAYEIFNDDFTIEIAEMLALDNFAPTNGTPLVLMSIYKKKNDLIRVSYLYAIYYELTKTGNRTFYSQLHKSDGWISSMDSHYKAIRMAFMKYDYEGLISFLNWASHIIIDGRYVSRFEICKTEIDRLIKNPLAKQNWEALISKLARDNIRQINSAFGYAIQCVYLLQFYNLKEESDRQAAEASIDQLIRFASFSKVNETTNFISLNIKMIDVMPETYVIKFAEFFERNSSILAENTEIDDGEIEELYVLLLKKYNETFEEEYVNLAIKYYDVFASRMKPHLDLYKNFCRSSNDKNVLFKMMFKLYSFENALSFHEFIYYNNWNCTDEESQVLELLRIVYSSEGDEIPRNLSCLTTRLLQSFKGDVAMMLQDYPRLTKYNTLMSNDESLAYKYLVLQYVMQFAFNQNVYWDISDKYWDVCDQDGVWNSLKNNSIDGIGAALGFYKVSYAKQCKYVQSLGIEYITRRYNNLYLIDLYDAVVNGSNTDDIRDEYIVELMRENNHVSLIYDKQYKIFKSLLGELCDSSLSMETKKILLLSIIRGTLCPLVDEELAFSELICKTEVHSMIKSLFEMMGYPSLAQSALFLYFNSTKSTDILSFCEITLPSTFNAIVSYNNLTNAEDKNQMRDFIDYACKEMNHKQFLLSVIGNKFGYYDESNYQTYKPILTNVIIATVFNYNILRDFGNVVRQGKIVFSNMFFRDLLVQMGEKEVYWYLCAVQYALNDKKEDATSAFYKVGGKSKVPELWEAEYENLDKYIKGEIFKFKTLEIYNDFSAQKETVIGNTILVDIALNYVSEDVTQVNARSAMDVFANSNSTPQEKLNAGTIILAFVKNDALQFSQNISKSPSDGSGEKITYNEFIFEYGLLVIKSRKMSPNKNVDVIVELYKYFDLLNDKNRRKFEERLKKAFVNLFATIKFKDDVVSYEQWIERYDDINEIVDKHKIYVEGYDFFMTILNKCVSFEEKSYTIMDKIRFLKSLPEGISAEPITKNLLTSAKKELEKLQNGVMAKMLTINCEIEDDSIFVLLENVPQSRVAIDLSPNRGLSKFAVTVFNTRTKETQPGFETYCSGNIGIIRPGQVSGERIVLPEYVTTNWADGDIIDITILFDVNGIKVCSNTEQGVQFTYNNRKTDSGIIAPQHRYETSSCAFTEDNKGYGRASDRKWLDTYIPTKGLSVVYGPSRVGKSSLLKYISNFLAIDYKHRQGVFASVDKKIDVLYVISRKENYHKLPEIEEEMLGFLFLEPIRTTLMSIVESDMIDSEDMDGDNISREAAEQILKLLDKSETELPLEKKLKTISKVLSINNAEIWVLIDEFQQVIERWPITQSVLFRDFCKQLKESIDNIRYVLCGSDELVKLMINRDPVMIMYKDKTRAIGQFTEHDKNDFADMLCDTMVWGSFEHPFTQEALNYIFSYTGGNAMYGKLIGNRIIDAIESGKFVNRKKIYPYDVSTVIAKMLSEQKSDIYATSAVNEFIANVTKNLETESPYLAYIASLMMKESERTSVTSSEIYEYFGALSSNERKTEIDTALLLCSVRGIINSSEEYGESVYSFSTTFYFSQYCEIVKRNGVPNRVANTEDEINNDGFEEKVSADEKLLTYFSDQSPLRQAQLLGGLLPIVHDSAKENVRKIVGDVFGGDKYHQEVHVNAQTINTAFTTLLTPGASSESFLAAFAALPKLTAYFGDDQKKKIKQGTRNLLEEYSTYESCFDDSGECIDEARRDEVERRIVIQEAELELLSAPAEQKLLSDTVGAVVNSDDFMTLSDQRWQELLGLKDTASVSKLKSLPSEFVAPLTFAVVLHNVFDNVCKTAANHTEAERDLTKELDYCPVAIMYCKIVEAMLKQGHTPMYIRGLGEKTLKNGGQTTFADLGTPDEFDATNKDLSIGSYVSHLVYLPKWKFSLDTPQQKPRVNDFWFTAKFKGETVEFTDNIRSLIGDEYMEDEMIPTWKSHARALKVIHEIRNRSAHEAVSITKENFDWLIEVLFKQGELLKIWELAEKGTI